MQRNRLNLPLWIGLALSLALHSFVIIPAMMKTMTASGETISLAATFHPKDIKRPEPQDDPLPPELVLGIDDGTPSTLTWLGYREYEQQQAPQSEVEQAAFTDDPQVMTAPPTLEPPVQAPVEQPSSAQEAAAPRPQQSDAPTTAMNDAEPSPAEASQRQPNEHAREQSPAEQQPNETAAELTNSPDAPAQPVATSPNISPTEAMFAFAEQMRELMELASSTAAQGDATNESSESSAAQPSASASPTDPNRERADMDSDPSSLVEVPIDAIRLGKPLAARGLTLRPQKPSFTTLTLMTAAPKNPLVEIDFGRDGRPLEARIVQSSRDSRVDVAIEASLYRWRAEGKPLALLENKQIITVQIRIILNSRARE